MQPLPKETMSSAVLERLIDRLQRLPGIGPRSAERIAFFLLRSTNDDVFALADAVRDVKLQLKQCGVCSNLTDIDPCAICGNPRRDRSIICVVEQPKDVVTIESTSAFNGVYHVLMGQVAPLEGVETGDLTIDSLVKRIAGSDVKEVIMATNPTLDGDGTALQVAEAMKHLPVKVTRLARGLTVGGQLDFTSKATLTDAITERRQL